MEYIKQQNLTPVQDKLLTPNSIENADFFRNVWDVVECGIIVLDVLDDGAEYRFAAFNRFKPCFSKNECNANRNFIRQNA